MFFTMNTKLLSMLLSWVSLYREKNMSYKDALQQVNREYKVEFARLRYRKECRMVRNFKNMGRRSGRVPKIQIQVCSREKPQNMNPYNEYGLCLGFSKPNAEEEQECPICLDAIFKNDAVQLGCSHVCCKTCMRMMFTKHAQIRCFMCRDEVKTIQVKSKGICKTLQQYCPKASSKITATDILLMNSPEYFV